MSDVEIFDRQLAEDIAYPPDYEAKVELTVGTTGSVAVIGGCFNLCGSWDDEPPNLTLYWQIKNLTDNVILLQGTINRDYPTCNRAISSSELRGKTIEFKIWNPNQNNLQGFRVQASAYTYNP